MLHLVCDCGSLVSVAPPPGARSARCKACSAVLEFPDPAGFGLPSGELPRSTAPAVPPPAASGSPVPPPQAGSAPAASPAPPIFPSDERLDLRGLEHHAARLGALSSLALLAGFAGVFGAAVLPDRMPADRILLGSACLFAGLVGWAACRGARGAARATVALAERQREMLQEASRRGR